jgi:hypothetical protein
LEFDENYPRVSIQCRKLLAKRFTVKTEEFILDCKAGAEPINETIKAAITAADASLQRGEAITMEQSTKNLKKRLKAWRKSREEVLTA